MTDFSLAIGLPQKTKRVLQALGLRKRMQTVYHEATEAKALYTVGQILKVKELVKVERVDQRKTRQEMKAERRPPTGFEVTGNLLER